MPPKHNRPPRFPRDEEDSGRPAKKMSREERLIKRERGGALPVEEVLPVETPVLVTQTEQEKSDEVAALFADVGLPQEKVEQEAAAPVPPALAEIYGDKTPPADEIKLYEKLEEIWQAQADADLASAQRNRRDVPQEVLDRISRIRKQNELDAKEGAEVKPPQELTQEQQDAELLEKIRVEDEAGDKKRAEARELATKEALGRNTEAALEAARKGQEAHDEFLRQHGTKNGILELDDDDFEMGPLPVDGMTTSGNLSLEQAQEKPPEELRDTLRATIGKFEDIKLQGKSAIGKSSASEVRNRRGLPTKSEILKERKLDERINKNEIYSRRRLKDLDAEGKRLGSSSEGWVTKSLKKYNALNWKKKVALSAGLMGITLAGAYAIPASFAAMVAFPTMVAAQRAIGMAGFMVKRREAIEQKIQANPNHALSESGELRKYLNAAGEATAYFALMGGATTALLYGGESLLHISGPAHDIVERAKESWLGHVLGHDVQVPEVHQPAAAGAAGAHAPEAVVPAHTEMPTVGASSHGYEGMMKNLWHQLQDKHITLPENTDHNSDLYKLVHADAKTIDTVAHRIAADLDKDAPRHAFFHADGTSIRIDPSAHMTIGTDGQIHFSDATHPDMVQAAPDMHTTPVLHHEAPVAHVEAPATTESHVRLEPPTTAHAPLHPNDWLYHGNPADTKDMVPHPDTVPSAAMAQSAKLGPPADGDWGHWGTPSHYDSGNPAFEHATTPSEHSTWHKTPDHVATSTDHATPNHSSEHAVQIHAEHPGVSVNLNETHGYLSNKGDLYVLGGDKAFIDAQAQDYALKHHVSVFVDKSYKLLGLINTPRFIEYIPNPNGTLTQVIHNGPRYVPDLKHITKQVF